MDMAKRIGVKIFGIRGKLGSAIAQEISTNALHFYIEEDAPKAQIVVDAASRESLEEVLNLALTYSIPLLIAATGHDKMQKQKIEEASKQIAILHSPNFSRAHYYFAQACVKLSALLRKEAEIELIELHHKQKKDAPSGSALKIASLIDPPVNIHSLRGSDIVGEHQLRIFCAGEEIEITHRAFSRKPFARGIVQALDFIHNKKPGLYTMEEWIHATA